MFLICFKPARAGRLAAWRLAALLTALLAAASTAVQAQSLQEVYEAARGYDASYLAARALAESAPFRAAQAEALLRPSAQAAADLTHTQVDPPSLPLRHATGSAVTVTGRQPLFNRVNSVTVSQARKALESSRFDLESAEQDLILRVAQAYFDVLAAQDVLTTTRTSKAAIAEQLASAQRNFEVGTATVTDTREAQARFDLASAQEIAADNDLLTRRIALDQLVGRLDVAPRPLALPVLLPPVEPAAVDTWAQRSESHPAVRRARLALDIAELETDKARAARLPTLDAVAQLSSGYSNNSASSGTSLPGTTNAASIGLQVNLSLYSGGEIQNRIQETLALLGKSRNDFDAARRAVQQATRQAYFNVQSGLAQVKALEAAESSSALALQATQLGYKVGVRVNLDVLNAQTQLFTTRRDLAQARYNVLLGGLRLRQAAGQLAPVDLVNISQLMLP